MDLLVLVMVFSMALLVVNSFARASDNPTSLNLTDVGRILAWTDAKAEDATELKSVADVPDGAEAVGVAWDDPRDVREIHVRFSAGRVPEDVSIEYWFKTWPPPPPQMPVMEDIIDDPWQGQWLPAETKTSITGDTLGFTFEPLASRENRWADHLPGVAYRRTLKIRVRSAVGLSNMSALEVFSDSVLEPLSVRIQLGAGQERPGRWSGHLEVFNGSLVSVRPWNFSDEDMFDSPFVWKNVLSDTPKGVVAELLVARPTLAGSNDTTVVTVRGESSSDGVAQSRTFSFLTRDLADGPIYVPDMQVCVTGSDDPAPFDISRFAQGAKIRDRIVEEPEQSYDRARGDIPPQDPWERQYGDKVYLVLAADCSWQKFAMEIGGNVFLGKHATKAFGAELKRLNWDDGTRRRGEMLRYWIGTGETPYYRQDHQARMTAAEGHLPIAINTWQSDGLDYEEEAFATLLDGPLSPDDPRRDEQTPAVLMVRLKAHNPSKENKSAHFWLKIEPDERLSVDGSRIYVNADARGPFHPRALRSVVAAPGGGALVAHENVVHCEYDVPAGKTETLYLEIPFVSDVSGADVDVLEELDYDVERDRVAAYWRALIDKTTRFTTPEEKFNHLARFVVAHIHISTTKDPKSGLYMVPAASYGYRVYANEACFQTLLLDALGDEKRAAQYLQTFVELQGSRTLPGNYVPPHDGIYHGAKVDDDYDYTAHDYSLDHGTTLWALARHYLYTNHKAWLEGVLPSMFKAVDWIERNRSVTRRMDPDGRPVPEFGLLPAGHLEDNHDWGYWFSVNAYCVAGMTDMAKALAHIGRDDEARRIASLAEAYRSDLRAAVVRAAESAPVTRLRDGTYSPYVPTRARQRFRQFGPLQGEVYSRYGKPADVLPCFRLSGTREVLYGPMILLDLEIFDPADTVAEWILDDWEDNLTLSGEGDRRFNVHGFTDEALWFSQGGMVWQSNLQNPILAYLKRNEVPAAIRNLYNNFVACLYEDINTLTEEYRMWGRASGPFYKSPDEARFVNRLRDMLVLESGDDLWLASGAPRRWLASREGIRVDCINSYFGRVRFTLRAGDEPGTVVARVHPPILSKPNNLWLYARLPDARPIRNVEINGTSWDDIDRDHERIRLPLNEDVLDVLIRY